MNKIAEFFVSRGHSFRHAFSGWWYVIRTQRNAWIHALATTLVALMALWLRLSLRDWAVLLVTIAAGIILGGLDYGFSTLVSKLFLR